MKRWIICAMGAGLVLAAVCLVGFLHKAPAKTQDIDGQIQALLESEAFLDGTPQDREDLARELMEELKDQGQISHYSYDPETGLFSFLYPDGSLGGIDLKEFEPQSGEPMNTLPRR